MDRKKAPCLRGSMRRGLAALRVAAVVALLALAVGCASQKAPVKAPLPPYGGDQAALFSDLFQPELFGMEGARAPERDALLPERAQRADYIAPMRVVTVTRQARGDVRSYTVVVEPTEEPLRGSLGQSSVSLDVADGSPTFAWLEIAGPRWVGTRVLLFLRHYQDGVHFFGAVDRPEIRRIATTPAPPPPQASAPAAPTSKTKARPK